MTDEIPPDFRRPMPPILPAAGIIALHIVLFGGFYLGRDVFYFRDTLINYVPYQNWFLHRVLAGELPLWNDLVRGGMPFWGDPVQGVLYPGKFLLLLMGGLHPLHAYSCLVSLHFLFAHAGYYRLLRTLDVAPAAAFFGSTIIALSPPALDLNWQFQFLAAFALLGWTGAALVKLLRNPAPRAAVLFSLWVALIVTTGDLQTAYLVGLVALLVAGVTGEKRARRTTFALFSLAAAGGLAAATILPGFELSRYSYRNTENTVELATEWSWNPARLTEWIAPGQFDPPVNIPTQYSRLERGPVKGDLKFYFPRGNPGLVILALLPVSLILIRKDRRILSLLCVAAAGYLVAAGEHAPFFGLIRIVLPGWNQFRYPERLLVPSTVALGIATAFAIGRLLDNSRETPPRWVIALSTIPLIACIAGTFLPGAAATWASLTGLDPSEPYSHWIAGCFRLATVPFTLAALFLWLPRKEFGPWLIGAAVVAEVLVVSSPGLRSLPLSIFSDRPLLAEKLSAVTDQTRQPSPRLHVALSDVSTDSEAGYTQFAWDSLRQNLPILQGFNIAEGYNSSAPADRELANRLIPTIRLVRLLGVELYVAPSAIPPGDGWNCDSQVGELGATICRSGVSLGAVRAPLEWETVDGRENLARAMQAPEWNPESLEYIGRFSGAAPGVLPVPSGKSAAARIETDQWTPEVRRFQVDRETPGPLVLRDNFFPGWKVRVDDEPGIVTVANGFQLAAWTPAGRHTVEFRYEPWTVFAGTAVSLVTAVALALVWFRRRPV